MLKLNRYLIACLITFVFQANAYCEELKVWSGKPIPTDLAVGHTRILDFGENVKFNAIAPIQNGSLEAFSLQGKLYLTPSAEFSIQQMRISYMDSGLEVLLEVSAIKTEKIPHDLIIKSPLTDDQSGDDDNQAQTVTQTAPLGTIDIIRFAAIDSYAPARLKKQDHRFSPQAVNKRLSLQELFIGQSYGLYESKLIKSWTVQNLYLTVIGVRNLSPIDRQLNLFDLNVDATIAVPQRIYLGKAQSIGDSTRIYVITTQPFENALGRTPVVL